MKFVNKKLAGLAIVTAILAGLDTPFNAWMYAYIFQIIDTKNVQVILPFIVLVILAYFGFSLAEYANTVVINKNVVTINQRLKAHLLRGVLERRTVAAKDFVTTNLSFFLNDLKLLEDNYIRQLFTLISLGITCVVTFGYSMVNNVWLTLVFLAFTVIPAVVPSRFSKRINARTRTWSQQNGQWSSVLKDVLKGALMLQQYRAFSGITGKTTTAIHGVEQANARVKNTIALSNAVAGALFYLCMMIPIGIGIYVTVKGQLSLSQFVAVQYSSNMIVGSATQFINSFNTLNSTGDIRRRIKTAIQPIKAVKLTETAFETLALQDLTFARKATPIFKDLTLAVNAGENVLIQGESGSGKTTLLRMIDGALAPTSGQVTINGQPAAQYGGMSTVNQTPVIFNDTLRFNLTLGMTFTDAAVTHACQEAGLTELLTQDGLDYQIGDEGENLSGGQVKRLEIARAILFDRELILIDEGTASLDEQTSIAIHQTILRLPKTIVEVDHHIPPEVLPLFDRVYTLQNGQLVAQQA
ncbi:ATP-binding cassette domain-containing protein [Levilactobacillus cerevisiae]|uniref:ATP-binding cassette domain-containing protein n=1 Tax=Levilactobacillus cerevisiae TaxID=1704076 RepID=UPI000F789357|nr:ABC transporter ATP-binding protein [Levilactobacillus cerevisiae]